MGSAAPLPAARLSGLDQLTHLASLRRDFLGQTFHPLIRHEVVAGGHRRARFLQSTLRVGVHASRRLEVARGNPGRFGDLDLLGQLPRHGERTTDRRFSGATYAHLAVGGLTRCLERALVGVDSAGQREAVVALLDSLVRLLHGGGRGRERFGCVLLGAGRACRLDGALGAIDFFLWRFGTGGEENQRADRGGETTHRPAV
jgi:hypothetical protein